MQKVLILLFSLFYAGVLWAQSPKDVFIKLTEPSSEENLVSVSQKFIIGSTCKSCTVKINNENVKVYTTGAFAKELNLSEGATQFNIVATSTKGKSVSKIITYNYKKPLPETATQGYAIERIQSFPEGDLIVKPGDVINFKVKATPNCSVKIIGQTSLFEMPDSLTKGIAGIYQGKYTIQPADTFFTNKIKVSIDSPGNPTLKKDAKYTITVLTNQMSDMVMTKGRLAHLLYGTGEDRLGGAKIGYIDSLIPLHVIGKIGTNYKVQLAPSRTAFIPDELVSPLPIGYNPVSSLTDKIRVYGDTLYDFVKLQLFNRLPYQSVQQTDPSMIVVDVFGATSNTNWIDQLQTAKEVKKVEYEQVADEIFRLKISLRHHQHWGHQIFYSGNVLVIKVKHQPAELLINKLTIAIDAGHGGTNTGAVGATGIAEKFITLPIALALQKLLLAQGAKVIMTRNTETFFDNKERILFYRDSTPDLLISIHLNSAVDPFRVSGTSTFYRYEGFRPLSNAIYKRMLELGVKEYGNNGSFNFMLNSPIEYPNALVETLFLSNLEEEEKILNEGFQQKIAQKIDLGIKDFLKSCE